MKVRIPKIFYEKLTDAALDKIILSYIKQENYEDLNIALSARTNNLGTLYEAVDYLDPKIIRAILNSTKKGDVYLNYTIDNVIENIIEDDFSDSLDPKLQSMSEQEIYSRKGKIINLLINFKVENINEINSSREEKIKIDQYLVEVLAQYNDETVVAKFIEDNKIDIREFKDTMIPYLLLKNAKLISDKVPVTCSAKEILLARTYLEDLESTSVIQTAYSNLLGWPKLQKILHYAVAEIVKGGKLKILFSTTSYYNPIQDLICIKLNPKDGFTIESIIAHEFGHFVMQKLFNNKCLPFQISSLKTLLSSQDEPHSKSNYLSGLDLGKLFNEKGIKEAWIKEVSSIFTQYMDYNRAAMEPLRLGERMISSDQKVNFDYTLEYIKYLKECTILPLFYLASYGKFTEKSKQSLDVALENNHSVQKTLVLTVTNLLELECIQEKEDNHKLFTDKKQSCLEYLFNTCIPLIIENFKLSPSDVHFLERIADILFRKGSIDKGTEHIVRYLEFLAMSNQDKLHNPAIMESFKSLEDFWGRNIFPRIDDNLSCLKSPDEKEIIDHDHVGLVEVTGDISAQVVVTDFAA